MSANARAPAAGNTTRNRPTTARVFATVVPERRGGVFVIASYDGKGGVRM